MAVTVDGNLPAWSSPKDVILGIINHLGVGGGIGHVVEYRGSTIEAMSMEGRMTVCNMSIEAGARAGLVAPDETTFSYIKGRPFAPAGDEWDAALDYWRSLPTEAGAEFDREVALDAANKADLVLHVRRKREQTAGLDPRAAVYDLLRPVWQVRRVDPSRRGFPAHDPAYFRKPGSLYVRRERRRVERVRIEVLAYRGVPGRWRQVIEG